MAPNAHRDRDDELALELGTLATFLERVAKVPAADSAELFEIADADPNLELTERIGEGGMGIVYLARDTVLDRQVALKLHRISGHVDADKELRNEAKAMAKLSHPNIVAVYDVRSVSGHLALLMEYVPGSTLREWLAAEPRETTAILEAFSGAGEGLAAAHAAGLVHRDFKPANVLVGSDGRVRVADFGLALSGELEHSGAGTPAYMAPEQKTGGALDARADQYAFCVALREALESAEPPRRVSEAIERGTSEDPGDRWPSMRALLGELAPTPEKTARRQWVAWLAAGSVLAAVLTGQRVLSCAVEEPSCGEIAAQWSESWNTETADDIRAAHIGASRPYAEDYLARSAAAFERYGKQWIAAKTTSCRADDERRTRCLDRQLAAARAALAVLKISDGDVTDHMPELTEETTAELCLSDESLSPMPEDAEAYRDTAARLEAIRVARLAGRSAAAKKALDEFASEGRDGSDGSSIRAELAFHRSLLGDHAAIRESDLALLTKPARLELAIALDTNVADQRQNLSDVIRADTSTRLLSLALQRLAANVGPDEKTDLLNRALAARRTQLGEENRLLRPLFVALGDHFIETQDFEQARPHLAATVAFDEKLSKPALRESLLKLATVEFELSRTEESAAAYERLLALADESDPTYRELVLGHGLALVHSGELVRATEVCGEARRLYEEAGIRDMNYAWARDCLGRAAAKLSTSDVDHFRVAAQVAEIESSNTEELVEFQYTYASALIYDGQVDAAFVVIEKWLDRANAWQRTWMERVLKRADVKRQIP